LGKTIVQKIAINCNSEIERSYYNPPEKRKSLVLENICIHCGDSGGLLSQDDLSTKGLTDGHELYPICSIFVTAGRKSVKSSKRRKSHVQARNEANESNKRIRQGRLGEDG
jgi:hypothetical protein